MYIFNFVLALLMFIIIQRIYSAIKYRKKIDKEHVMAAWENGQRKANSIYRNQSIVHIKKIIESNILLSLAIKNKNGSKEKNFELAYLTLAETVSLEYFVKRVENPSIEHLYEDKEIYRYVKKRVFSILRDKEPLEKEFKRSLFKQSLINGEIKPEYKKDVYEIIKFITEIAESEKK